MKRYSLLSLLSLLIVGNVFGQGAQLLNDINPTVIGYTNRASKNNLYKFDNKLYYGRTGQVSAGVSYEVNVASNQSRYFLDATMSYPQEFSGHLYFYGTTPGVYWNLYRLSAGTSGATLVMDSVTNFPSGKIAAVGNDVFFSSRRLTSTTLWRTNPMAPLPSPIKKFSTTSTNDAVQNLETVNGEVFFTVKDSLGNAIWKTDGTTAGTVRIATINSAASIQERSSASINNTYFVITGNSSGGAELWRSDGTSSGTFAITEVSASATTTTYGLVTIGNKLFFNVLNGADKGLWVTDGSLGNTVRLDTGLVSLREALIYAIPYYDSWGVIGNKLVYPSLDAANGRELWITDGTVAGTQMIKDINPGTGSSFGKILNTVNNEVCFTAFDPANGLEIWKTDGTNAGTQLWLDISQGAASSKVNSRIFQLNNRYYFVIDSTLTESDGTIQGTAAVNLPVVSFGSNGYLYPQQGAYQYSGFTVWNGAAYFGAFDEQYFMDGNTVWKTDGTPSGTQKLAPNLLEQSSSQVWVRPTFAAGTGYLAFAGVDSLLGAELWKSDGTASGTVMIKDILPGSGSSKPANLFTASDGNIYFAADTIGGQGIFKTDGT